MLAPTSQAFFTHLLIRNATPARTPSPPTATFKLLLAFTADRAGIAPGC